MPLISGRRHSMMLMTSSPSSLNWSSHEDSAFHEVSSPIYSNTTNKNSFESSYNSGSRQHSADDSYHSSPSPDYEEVNHYPKGLVYNLASEGIFKSGGETDPMTREKIMKSVVYCIHKEEGCKWSGQLNKLKAHLNTCQKDAVACLNQCGAKIARLMMEDHMLYTCKKRLVACRYCKKDFTGSEIDEHQTTCGFEPVHCENKCGQKIQRNRLRAHQVNTCSKRMVTCQYCQREFTAETLQTHHRTKCPSFPVPCPNRCGMEDSLTRDDVERHLAEECQGTGSNRLICVYNDAGCQFRASTPSEMAQHEQEATRIHLDLMSSLVRQQSTHIARLTSQLERAHTSYNGVLMWKIKDFAAKMAEAKSSEGLELVSIPFFTSTNGYKLQASMFLNGNGSGEGSHISVYIKILPGEFDNVLRWPFQHTVSFSLIDQNEDRDRACNLVESFVPDPSWPNFQRPSREPDQLGFGFPKFVSHEMVLHEQNYLRDDAIFLKIRVDPSRNVAV